MQRRLDDIEGLERLFREVELPLIPVLARMEAVGVALDLEALAILDPRVRGGDLAARAGHLHGRRPRVQPRQPEAARAGAVLRAQPSEGSERRPASPQMPRCSRSRPAHPMIDKLLEWRVYTKLRSTYVEALRPSSRPTVGCTRPSTRPLPRPDACRPPIPICRTSRSGPSSAARSAARSWPGTRPRPARRRLLPDRAAHPRPRVGRRAPRMRSPAAPTSIARRRRASSARRRRTSRTPSARWRRWSTSGWPGMRRLRRTRANISRQEAQSFINSYFTAYSRDQLLHDGHQGPGQRSGLRRDAARAKTTDPGAQGVQPGAAGQGSGWPSTCRSRRTWPPTSRRSR